MTENFQLLLVLGIGLAAAADWGQFVLMPSKYNEASEIREQLKDASIIPDVISDFEPQYRLDVEWPTDESASLGNTLDPEKLQDAPTVSLAGPLFIDGTSLAGMTHVLAVTDPDAPSRDNPKWSEFCHWIASGLTVPGADTTTGGKAVPEHVIMSYKPPGPPPGTGKHRYVFLVLVPRNSTTDALHLTKPSGRQRWGYDEKGRGVRDWADENGLIPVAANFIYSFKKK